MEDKNKNKEIEERIKKLEQENLFYERMIKEVGLDNKILRSVIERVERREKK